MTESRTKSCTLCMLLPLVLGLIGFSTLYWFTKDSKAEQIQNDLSLRSNQLLQDKTIGNVIVNMDGRNATLTGTAAHQSRSDEIEQIIAAMPGIRTVDNQLVIASTDAIETNSEVILKPKLEPLPEFEPEPTPEVAMTTEAVTVEVNEEVVEELLQTLDLSGITFLFGSDEITQKGKLVLNDVIDVLKEHPEFKVAIEGHTDSVGDDELNLQLSQQRAQSVLEYLNNNGIQAQRLTATGFGETSPIANNDSIEGRALNRRIEFVVTRI